MATRSLVRIGFVSAVGLVAVASPARAEKPAGRADWVVAARISPTRGQPLAPVTFAVDGEVDRPQCGGFEHLAGWDLEVCRLGGDRDGQRFRVHVAHQDKDARQSYEGEIRIGKGRHTIAELPGGTLTIELGDAK